MTKIIRQAIAAKRAGDIEKAQQLLAQLLQTRPNNKDAWLWASDVCETDEERRYCLEQVLAVAPGNQLAKRGLSQLAAGESRRPTFLEPLPAEPVTSDPALPTRDVESSNPPSLAPTTSNDSEPGNPFVAYLNRYTTVSSEHEAAFDEFITQVAPPSGEPLRIETQTERFLNEQFRKSHPPSVILTGNAGDGKTYLCRQIIKTFTGQPVNKWTQTVWPIEKDSLTLRVVKDLSEMGEDTGAEVLAELNQALGHTNSNTVFLMAANEGRLRALLAKGSMPTLSKLVDDQLKVGPNLDDDQLIVLNLNRASTSSYVEQALAWLTNPKHWEACQSCPALQKCPIQFNATRLAEALPRKRLTQLYQILEHLSQHVTIRDMLIHLSYTVTGGLNCKEVIEKRDDIAWKSYQSVYYENTWGQHTDDTFQRKVAVIQHLRHLNVGHDSLFDLDDFIINGAPTDDKKQAEHDRLFAPALDLGNRLFSQAHQTYLQGGGSSPNPDETHELIKWLPQMRRKLFFEWQDESKSLRLFPFRFLPDYLRLLRAEQSQLNTYRRDLILGLNRAFSGLFINENSMLYVTSQYTSSHELPVPIVQVQVSEDNIKLQVQEPQAQALDQSQPRLYLEIAPPGFIEAKPIRWDFDLLSFEYLLRRARGGTANILAEECELSIRRLKDQLLAEFVVVDSDELLIKFFAADRYEYTLKTIGINPKNGQFRVQ